MNSKTKMMKYLTFLSMLLMATFSFAQDAKLTMQVSSDTVNLETPFEVTFTIEGQNAGVFQQPEFEDFIVVYQNQSTQMNITNGEMKKSVSYTYGLQAKENGSFAIEKASLNVDGTMLYTDFTKVVVDENYVPKAQPKNEMQMEFRNPFENFFGPDMFPQPEAKPKKKKSDRKVYKI
jgi:hypothetical protein